MSRPKSYRDLIVWQKAMVLARNIYLVANEFPHREAFGLTGQIKRAAVSVPSNIAEGHGRLTDTQFRHFLGNARGSLCELQTQLELATDLGFVNKEAGGQIMEQASEVARLINGLLASLKNANPNHPTASAANTANAANNASTAKAHV